MTIRMIPRNTVLALALSAGLLTSCATLSTQVANTEVKDIASDHPHPNVEYGPEIGVGYFRQGGFWYQLRITLTADPLKKDADDGSYRTNLNGVASIWRYNRLSGTYDREVRGGTRSNSGGNIAFFVRPEKSGVLKMQEVSGGGSSGSSGLVGRNYNEVELDIQPQSDGGDTENGGAEIEVTAKAKAIINMPRWTNYAGVPMAEAKVERKWIARLAPDGEIKLVAK